MTDIDSSIEAKRQFIDCLIYRMSEDYDRDVIYRALEPAFRLDGDTPWQGRGLTQRITETMAPRAIADLLVWTYASPRPRYFVVCGRPKLVDVEIPELERIEPGVRRFANECTLTLFNAEGEKIDADKMFASDKDPKFEKKITKGVKNGLLARHGIDLSDVDIVIPWQIEVQEEPPSDKQRNYILALAGELQHEYLTDLSQVRCVVVPGRFTAKTANSCINELQELSAEYPWGLPRYDA